MGFQEEIEAILARVPKERQTLLFSATIPEEIERIARRHMREPSKISLSQDFVGVYEIHHAYYLVSGVGRTRELLRVLEYEQPPTALIFCNTRDDTALVAAFLRQQGLDAESISGDLTQAERERVMQLMKERKLRFLVATDIAARGIDISDLACVINYTFPESPDIYIHRTGRTGRAGRRGLAVSLVSPQELGNFYYLKLLYKIRPEERDLPSDAELRTRREAERFDRLRREVLDDPGEEWCSLARRLWQSGEGERVVGELLRRRMGELPPRVGSVSFEEPPRRGAPEPASHASDEPHPRERDERSGTRGPRGRDGRPARAQGEEGRKPRERGGDAEGRRSRDRGEHASGSERPRSGETTEGGRPRDRDHRRGRRSEPAAATSGPAAPTRPAEPAGAAGPAEPAGAAGPAEPAGPGGPDVPPGVEFWEAWVDQRGPRSQHASADGAAPSQEREAEREREREPEVAEPGTVRLYLNLGRRDGARGENVAGLVSERAQLEPLRVQLRNTHSYLVVKEEDAPRVVSALNGTRWGERDLLCEPARGR
jgi:ATP-dependent RNA helicase DeaD